MFQITDGGDFRKKIRSISNGIYLFYGEEEYTKRYCLESLRKMLCPDPSLAAFGHIRLSAIAPEFKPGKVSDACESVSFFGSDKLTELHDLDFSSMKDSELKDWLALLENCSFADDSRNILVIYCLPSELDGGLPNKPSALLKKLCSVLTPVCFSAETPAHLLSWVSRHFTSLHVMASVEVCQQLIRRCGSSMFALDNEVQKLAAYVLSRGDNRVTEADLNAVCCVNVEVGDFDFTNALLACDPDAAFRAYTEMKNRKERPELLLGSVISTYDMLYRVKACLADGLSVAEIASAFHQNEYRIKIYQRACSNFTLPFLAGAVRACTDADLKLKSSSLEPYTVLETLLATLTPRRR